MCSQSTSTVLTNNILKLQFNETNKFLINEIKDVNKKQSEVNIMIQKVKNEKQVFLKEFKKFEHLFSLFGELHDKHVRLLNINKNLIKHKSKLMKNFKIHNLDPVYNSEPMPKIFKKPQNKCEIPYDYKLKEEEEKKFKRLIRIMSLIKIIKFRRQGEKVLQKGEKQIHIYND